MPSVTAQYCACCGAKLTDAVSIERGIGPICSAKYYELPENLEPDFDNCAVHMDLALEQKSLLEGTVPTLFKLLQERKHPRKIANILIYAAAVYQGHCKQLHIIRMIAALGFQVLAQQISVNSCLLRVEKRDDEYLIKTPFSPELNQALYFRKIRSSFVHLKGWGRGKVRKIRATKHSRKELWAALQKVFPQHLLHTETGMKIIP